MLNHYSKIFLGFITFFIITSCSDTPAFDHYGVYIKNANNKYIELKSSDINLWSYTLKIFDQNITPVLIKDSLLEFVIYSPKAKMNKYKLLSDMEMGYKNFKNYSYSYYKLEDGHCTNNKIDVKPFKENNEMIKLISTFKTDHATRVLTLSEEHVGYIIYLKTEDYENNLKRHTEKMIKLLYEKKYKDFLSEAIMNDEIWRYADFNKEVTALENGGAKKLLKLLENSIKTNRTEGDEYSIIIGNSRYSFIEGGYFYLFP